MKPSNTPSSPATPLPWKISGTGFAVGGGRVVFADCGERNTAYIIHAANAYPRLVAELKRLCVEIPAQLGGAPMKNQLLRDLGEQE